MGILIVRTPGAGRWVKPAGVGTVEFTVMGAGGGGAGDGATGGVADAPDSGAAGAGDLPTTDRVGSYVAATGGVYGGGGGGGGSFLDIPASHIVGRGPGSDVIGVTFSSGGGGGSLSAATSQGGDGGGSILRALNLVAKGGVARLLPDGSYLGVGGGGIGAGRDGENSNSDDRLGGGSGRFASGGGTGGAPSTERVSLAPVGSTGAGGGGGGTGQRLIYTLTAQSTAAAIPCRYHVGQGGRAGGAGATAGTAGQDGMITITWPGIEVVFLSRPRTIQARERISPRYMAVATNADGRIVSYAWTATLGTFDLASSFAAVWTAPTLATAQSATVTLTVTDDTGATASASIVFAVAAGNFEPTVAINTPRQNVIGGQSIPLSITTSDSDGTVTSYAWEATAGTFDDATIAEPTWTAPAPTAVSQQPVITVTVTDDGGATASDSVTFFLSSFRVTVTPAGIEVGTEEQVPLTAVTNAATVASYAWSATSGTFDDPASARPVWTAPATAGTARSAIVSVTVTDSTGLTAAASGTYFFDHTFFNPSVNINTEDQTILGGESITLSASPAAPSGRTIASYTWAASRGTLSDPSAAGPTWTAPQATGAIQTAVITLTVTDSAGRSATGRVTFTIPALPAVPQSRETLSTPGAGTWTVPDGVTEVLVAVVGAGGGGAGDGSTLGAQGTPNGGLGGARGGGDGVYGGGGGGGTSIFNTGNVNAIISGGGGGGALAHVASSGGNGGTGDRIGGGAGGDEDFRGGRGGLGSSIAAVGARVTGGNGGNTAPPGSTIPNPRVGGASGAAEFVPLRDFGAGGAGADRSPTIVSLAQLRPPGGGGGGGGFNNPVSVAVTPGASIGYYVGAGGGAGGRGDTSGNGGQGGAIYLQWATANQGPDVTITTAPRLVEGGDEVALATAATDSDGVIRSYAWTATAGTFADDTVANPTWTAPATTPKTQFATLTVTVTDDRGASATASVVFSVAGGNELRVTTATSGTFTVPEGVTELIVALVGAGGGGASRGITGGGVGGVGGTTDTLRTPAAAGINGGGGGGGATVFDAWIAAGGGGGCSAGRDPLSSRGGNGAPGGGLGGAGGFSKVGRVFAPRGGGGGWAFPTTSGTRGSFGQGGFGGAPGLTLRAGGRSGAFGVPGASGGSFGVGGAGEEPTTGTQGGGGGGGGGGYLRPRRMAVTPGEELSWQVGEGGGGAGGGQRGGTGFLLVEWASPNEGPAVLIGTQATTVKEKQEVSLITTATDTDGTIESYAWTAAAGTFSDATISDPVWTAPLQTALSQPIVLTVTVTDDRGATASDSVTMTVLPWGRITLNLKAVTAFYMNAKRAIKLYLNGRPIGGST